MGPPTRFPGNPTYHSGIAAVLRPGEYHRVTPVAKIVCSIPKKRKMKITGLCALFVSGLLP